MLFTCEARDLRKMFPVLEPLDDMVCVPVFSGMVARFLEDLSTDFGKYGIESFDPLSQFDGKNTLDDVYAVMRGSIIVKVVLRRTDIYMVNGGLTWYLPSSIIFNAGNASDFAEDLYKRFVDFVKKQNFAEVKRETILALRKGRAKSLRPGIVEFYLEQS